MRAALVLAGVALLIGAGLFWSARSPGSGALYCISRPGFVLGGDLGRVPPGFHPSCPDSASYRRDVLAGHGRVERYTVSGDDLLASRARLLRQSDFQVRTSDWPDSDTVLSLLRRGGQSVLYQAQVRGGETVVTLAD